MSEPSGEVSSESARPLGISEGESHSDVGRIRLVALAVLGPSLVLRFFTVSDLWLDEALTVNIASLPLDAIPDALRSDGLPPLYYGLLHFWMKLFGSGDLAVRSLSGVFGVCTVILAGMVGRRWGGTRVGWMLAIVAATCPFLVRYSTEARMYSLLTALVLCGWLVAHRLVNSPSWGGVLIGAVVSGALMLTHYWSAYLLAATTAVFVVMAVKEKGLTRRGALAVVASAVGGGLLFLPWLPIFLDQLSKTGTPWAGPQRPLQVLATTLGDMGGGSATAFRDGEVYGWLVFMLGVVALVATGTTRNGFKVVVTSVSGVRVELVIVAVGFSIAIAASWLTGSAYATRYASVFVPLILLSCSAGLERIGTLARPYLLLALVLLGAAGSLYVATRERTQAGEIAAKLAEDAEPGDVVVYCPDQLGPAVHRLTRRYELDVEEVVYHPDLRGPETIDWVEYVDRHRRTDAHLFAERVRSLASSSTIWLVHSPTYRGVGETCDRLVGLLGRDRRIATVVHADGDRYFEHASLTKMEQR